MRRDRFPVAILILLGLFSMLLFPAWAEASEVALIDRLGTHHHEISTDSPIAQRYFDQGLVLTYGFNHPAALQSFQAAAAIDPTCAMCYWGMAYVLGPNINAAMETAAIPTAWNAIDRAIELGHTASAPEQSYIEALAERYSSNRSTANRATLNLDYANAMRQVMQQYPDDLDAATLFAEALMDTTPWNYWEDNGEPNLAGQEIVATLESVLKRDPNHLGALHYYIHAVEKKHPDRAITVADRLRDLHLPAGHLAHMPSHIYLRVGRYQDAMRSNQDAIALDQEYAQEHPQVDIYALSYMPHNSHFLWFAAMMAGQQQVALEAANQTAAGVDPTMMRQAGYGTLQHYRSIPLYTYVKFGLWDEILAEPAPAVDLRYPIGVWHYARGLAFVAQNQPASATVELQKLQAIAADPTLVQVTLWDINKTADLLQIASEMLAGELAASQGEYEAAIADLQNAVDREDQLSYDEPPPWPDPVRQSLAAVLLKAGRLTEAEQTYRADLDIYPNNRWSLNGLAQSLKAQQHNSKSAAVEEQLKSS